MPVTLDSLPNKLLLEILGCLPRPFPVLAPLLPTSLVSKRFRALSQKVLFQAVHVTTVKRNERWSVTAARKWTAELLVFLPAHAQAGRELEAALRRGGDAGGSDHRALETFDIRYAWSAMLRTGNRFRLVNQERVLGAGGCSK